MILIFIGSLTFLLSAIIFWRRAVEMRATRWELYRLRDELRSLAWEDRNLLSSDVFLILDARLTAYCSHLEKLSLWAILPNIWLGDRNRIEGRQRDFVAKLSQPRNARLSPIYRASSMVFAKQLAWRHMFLTLIAMVTVVGFIVCYHCTKWLSERILSDAVKPNTASRIAAA